MKFLTLRFFFCLVSLLGLSLGAAPSYAADAAPRHGMALYDDLKYPAGFSHFDYVNPDAPKGGQVVLAHQGSFDSLNPFILKGNSAPGIGMTFDTLMTQSGDEAFSLYGLVAESVTMAPDRSFVIFKIRDIARFHDGSKITADDVVATFTTLLEKGHPLYKSYYHDVEKVTALDKARVKFSFAPNHNRELPLLMGQLPVLSATNLAALDFARSGLTPLLGSGPYQIKNWEAGRSITYERAADYWAKDLPVNKGRYNFDHIRFDIYRDGNIAIEAFKAGAYDFRSENIAKNWATSYDFPAQREGKVVKETIRHENPTGMQGFWFNTRRAPFDNPKIREALAYAFDFEWANEKLFYNAYTRTESFFSNSELASTGLPTKKELKLLNPWRDVLPKEVFTKTYTGPSTLPPSSRRDNLIKARDLLREAGWVIEDFRLVNQETKQPLQFEILLHDPIWERVCLPFLKNLERLGIKATIRTVDASQYQKRLEQYDFDMVVVARGQSLSPGYEQYEYWHSRSINTPGGQNLAGIQNPAIDALVEKLVAADNRDDLKIAAHALDRALLWGHYVIPHWHIRDHRIAYWNKFARPDVTAKYDLGFLDTWWFDPQKAVTLDRQESKTP